MLCNTCAAGSFSARCPVERLSLPKVLGLFTGVNLRDALCLIPARDPARCSMKQPESATRQGYPCSPCESCCGTCWDAAEIPGCGVGCRRDPGWAVGGWAHQTGGWKTSKSHYPALLGKRRNICSYQGCCSSCSPGQKPRPGNSAPLSCLLWLFDRNASIWKEKSGVWK